MTIFHAEQGLRLGKAEDLEELPGRRHQSLIYTLLFLP